MHVAIESVRLWRLHSASRKSHVAKRAPVGYLDPQRYSSWAFLLSVRRSTSDLDKSCPKYISSANRRISDLDGIVPIVAANSIRLASMSLRRVSDILKLS